MQFVTARDAADLFALRLGLASREQVAVAHLDCDRLLLAMTVWTGGADAAPLPISEIIAEALRLRSSGLVVAHNHPSGVTAPSAADIAATRRLAEAAAVVDIRLHDHLVFAGGACRSLRGQGLL